METTKANERKVVRQFLKDAAAAGYKFNVDNGGDILELPAKTNDVDAVLNAMFATMDEYVIVYKDDKYYGSVRFIYCNGNDGFDVVADHTTNLDHVMNGVRKITDAYEKEHG